MDDLTFLHLWRLWAVVIFTLIVCVDIIGFYMEQSRKRASGEIGLLELLASFFVSVAVLSLLCSLNTTVVLGL